jgi:hypothetical protein
MEARSRYGYRYSQVFQFPKGFGKDDWSAVANATIGRLNERKKIGYDVVSEHGKLAAANLQAV